MDSTQIIEELSQSLFLRHSFDAILLVSPALEILACNEETVRTLVPDQTASKLQGKNLAHLHFPNLEKLVEAFFKDEEDTKIDSALSLNFGEEQRIFDIKLSKVPDDRGNVVVAIVFLREISFEIQREQRLWQSNEELSILYEMSKVEVQSLKHDEILQNVLQKFSELTNLSKGFFLQQNKGGGEVVQFMSYNLSPEEEAVFLPFLTESKLPPELLQCDARVLPVGKRRHSFYHQARELSFQEMVCIPVFLKDEVFGTLVFFSEEGDLIRISSNKRFFNLIGQQVGLALEKAKLFNELERSFREIATKNKQFNEELALAQKMQRGILALNFPKKPGVRFAVKYIPSYHLSGDFYDIFEISHDKVGVLIADVCGHGINSALVTSFLKASVRDMSQNHQRPDHLLDSLNKKLWDLLNAEMFVSAFYLIIDLTEKKLHYSNAGHPYPMIYHGNGKETDYLKVDGTLLSVLKDSEYAVCSRSVVPGDRVIMYTDGIFDMKNKKGEFVSMDFVQELTLRYARLDGYDFIDALINRLYKFGNIQHFEDDINLIVVDFFDGEDQEEV